MQVSLGPVQSFQSCVLSWFFLWHLVWLSIMQLRLYLFIGTLNPTLERLANNDPVLGEVPPIQSFVIPDLLKSHNEHVLIQIFLSLLLL